MWMREGKEAKKRHKSRALIVPPAAVWFTTVQAVSRLRSVVNQTKQRANQVVACNRNELLRRPAFV